MCRKGGDEASRCMQEGTGKAQVKPVTRYVQGGAGMCRKGAGEAIGACSKVPTSYPFKVSQAKINHKSIWTFPHCEAVKAWPRSHEHRQASVPGLLQYAICIHSSSSLTSQDCQ
jgi:hypothetical protein